ncbi:UPF0496 protein 1-like [Cornus florida]|uniref:UPF0496 protein 1-like n=1 Tax=Cornus florida TaxID=4283 RepID=UPI00289EF2B3|nr:UPF0496 protein 1-like [Cornus florida]
MSFLFRKIKEHSQKKEQELYLQLASDLSSYEAACRSDPFLQSFDSTLQQSTSRVINSLVADVRVGSLTLNSLGELTGYYSKTNELVVKFLEECKEDILKDEDLFDIVKDYFDNSLQTLDFCTALEKCLKGARDSQLTIEHALQPSEEEQRDGLNGKRKIYSRTLQELKNFKTADDPFTKEFLLLFQSLYASQMSVLKKLKAKKGRLGKKWKKMKLWRTLWDVIFVVTFASAVIFTVSAAFSTPLVAAAISAPLLAALGAAATTSLVPMRHWINSLWKKFEKELKGHQEIIHSVTNETHFAIWDLDNIRVLVDTVEIKIGSLFQTADFAVREEEDVMVAIEDIKKKLSEFKQTIEKLSEHNEKCSTNIMRGREKIMETITKHHYLVK